MSWLPPNEGQQPQHPSNYQDSNEFDQTNQFLQLSTPSPDGFNLIFDPHSNTQNAAHFHEFLPPPTNTCNNEVEVPEIPDTCFNYITELLKDDNPGDQTVFGTLQDYMAYQTYYQCFTDTLSGSNPNPNPNSNPQQAQHSSNRLPSQSYDHRSHVQFVQHDTPAATTTIFGSSSHGSNSLGNSAEDFILESQSNLTSTTGSKTCSLEYSLSQFPLLQQALFRPNASNLQPDRASTSTAAVRIREELDVGDDENELRRKQNPVAAPETYNQISEYEENIFCPEGRYDQQNPNNSQQIQSKSKKKNNSKKNQAGGGRKSKPEVVDLMSLLINCGESVSRMDIGTARDQLNLIRKHSSPQGDSLQRVSHYLANALDQRLSSSSSSPPTPPSATDFLRASRIFVAAAPFNIMSYYVCNKTMQRLAGQSSRVHIIDFGIAYGLQWPCLIYNLSKVEPTPPKLRITGIDLPESGFRPRQRLEETGRCLRKYSERFKLEFEYKAIVAERWESVTLEEIGVRIDEFTVVNSLYRSQCLYDESVDVESSPRDTFLELVRKIKPNYFVHGVVNGNLNGPFFIMRFKETVTHYASLFEVFDATMPREDPDRAILEEKLFGEALRNVVACESTERLERPETYRRWNARKVRAGFKQVTLEKEMLRRAKAMVQKSFRKEFMMEDDCNWAVQGWKGRILYAISCWAPQD